jgi:hypothetical protein
MKIMFVVIGRADRQARFDDAALLLGEELIPGGVYRLLAEHGDQLSGDDYFADLFTCSRLGRPTVAARVVATVMLLQAFEGLSEREACDRLAFDLRWKAAAGLAVGAGSFHPTVLVGMRTRLRGSDRPGRLFEDVNATARAAGVVGRAAPGVGLDPAAGRGRHPGHGDPAAGGDPQARDVGRCGR